MTTEEELRLWVVIWKQIAEEEAVTRSVREDEIVDMQISFQRMHRRAQKAEAKLIKLAKGSALIGETK
jgi:hypothetical protein